MVTPLNMVAESNDYQKQAVDYDSTRRLQEFKQHFENSSLEEKIRIAQFWDGRMGVYTNRDPKLEAELNGKTVEETEQSEFVPEDSKEDVDKVNEFWDVLNKIPNVSEAQKKATKDTVYAFANNSGEEIDDTIAKNNKMEDKSDKDIEA